MTVGEIRTFVLDSSSLKKFRTAAPCTVREWASASGRFAFVRSRGCRVRLIQFVSVQGRSWSTTTFLLTVQNCNVGSKQNQTQGKGLPVDYSPQTFDAVRLKEATCHNDNSCVLLLEPEPKLSPTPQPWDLRTAAERQAVTRPSGLSFHCEMLLSNREFRTRSRVRSICSFSKSFHHNLILKLSVRDNFVRKLTTRLWSFAWKW